MRVNAENVEQQADTVIILSSRLIAEVMEAYFNSSMFKQPVAIVDLKATESGYAFSIAFKVPQKAAAPQSVSESLRDKRGRFLSDRVTQPSVTETPALFEVVPDGF